MQPRTMLSTTTVYDRRRYRIKNVAEAKEVSTNYLKSIELENVIDFGLPEVDDRYHVWRVPLLNHGGHKIGEVVMDGYTSLIQEKKTTDRSVLEARLLGRTVGKTKKRRDAGAPRTSHLRNTIGLGDSEDLLAQTPSESVDLIFTSPPYYNARPEYSDYVQYEEYLLKMRKIIHQCHRVLNEGRFFVMNVAPVLVRRSSRSEASRRIAVPFDFHRIFMDEGFEFLDDIIWMKPEGAGWATGRGRRFAADRHPLQYKAVPVTEYVLVYRKATEKLIDWHIRRHPDRRLVDASRISDGYERTNVWKIHPAHSKKHPAVFPAELAEKVIRYYSFVHDVVLDPFSGIGTVGEAAARLDRRFVLFEINEDYVCEIKSRIEGWIKNGVSDVNWMNCDPVRPLNQYGSDGGADLLEAAGASTI